MSGASGDLVVRVVGAVLPLLVFAGIGIVAMRRGRRLKGSPPDVAPDGTMTVQVRGLYLRRGSFAGESRNDVNPRFAIAPDGIRFRVVREGRLAFSSIDHVDVREGFGRLRLLFLNTASPRLLSVDVGDRATAKLVLDALPGSIRLTPEAATIRDGVPTAGTSGLRRYHGPVG
jgi:hypothetical protein